MRVPISLTTIATLFAASAFVLSSPRPSQAKEYPYCMNFASGLAGVVEECSYETLAQCQLGTAGISGTCFANRRLAYGQQIERGRQPLRQAR